MLYTLPLARLGCRAIISMSGLMQNDANPAHVQLQALHSSYMIGNY